jgi:nucleoside phosphorylase
LDNTEKLLRAVILTALPVECHAVRTHLIHLHPEPHPEGSVYWSGLFSCESCSWDVKVAEIGPGNTGATLETERAIAYIKPQVALFVGVAGGLKDMHIGDVVAARKICSYESGKASNTFLPRSEVGYPTHRMLHWARITAGSRDWVQRIKGTTPIYEPKVLVEPIAAGEKVVNSTRSLTYTFLREQYSDAVAVEMEGYGFLHAVHANQRVNAIVIRGISDLIEGKSEADAANSQELASRHASAFAFEMLSKLGSDKHFIASIAKARIARKTSQGRQPTVKYSITNSGQMAVGPNAHMTVFNNRRNPTVE